MLRFLVPATLMVGALLALLAGAVGDWHGLPETVAGWSAGLDWPTIRSSATSPATIIPVAAPQSAPQAESTTAAQTGAPQAVSPAGPFRTLEATPPAAAPFRTPEAMPPAAAPPNVSQVASHGPAPLPASGTLQRQDVSLQAQIDQRTKQLATLNADTDKARHELDTLRQQQQQAETASNSRQRDQYQQAEARDHARRQRSDASATATATRLASARPIPVFVPTETQLAAAREALTNGRTQEARLLLARAQSRLVFQPVQPDQTSPIRGNPAAVEIGEAIRLLDMGDISHAVQAIDAVNAQGQPPAYGMRSPSGPQSPPPPGYHMAN